MYYQIHIQGYLEPHWSTWFDNLIITHDINGDTMLAGPVRDQTALYGLLDKARDLGLTLIAVARYEPEPRERNAPIDSGTGAWRA